MAVYFQGYNPWREQLAGSILAPLLKAALERGQQADMNRKENAFIDEAMKQFQSPVDTSMPSMLQGFEGPQPANPWEASANDTGLMRGFDTDFGAQAMTPQAPTMQDIQRNLAELQASDRFNMLSPDRTRQLMAPMMEQYAAAENARKMQDFFDQFAGKQDPFERFVHMARGAGMKYMPDRAVGDFVDLYKHQTPHQKFEQVNTGDRALGYTWNPATGDAREVFAHDIRMNPYQVEDLANDRMRIGISAGQLGLAREKWEYEKVNGGVDGNYQFLQDPEGNFITANRRTGELTPTNVRGAVKNNAWERMPEKDKIRFQSLLKLKGDIMADVAAMGHTADSPAILADIDRQLQQLWPDGPEAISAGLAAINGSPGGTTAGTPGKRLSPTQYRWLKEHGQTDESIRQSGFVIP